MKGSCSGCPSSTAPLKHGIQNLLRHFVPDVVKVRPVWGLRGAGVDPLRVLAIDTALEACSAAILDTARGDGVTSRSLPMARRHAEALVPLIATVMSEANVAFAELDRIAVTVGPGSFTGLRGGADGPRRVAL